MQYVLGVIGGTGSLALRIWIVYLYFTATEPIPLITIRRLFWIVIVETVFSVCYTISKDYNITKKETKKEETNDV